MTADGAGTAADPMTNTVVGGYRIRRRLGEGGMGRVYAAEDLRTGFQVAIKVISEEHAGSPPLVERFFAEARAVNLIAHENIVAVHDLARLPDGRPYIVMDLLEGSTVRAILRTRRLPLGAVIHVINDVLGALSAAHAVGVVHRDLKPDNVLVDPTGRAKLLDFGIAKLVGDNVGAPLARTRTGALLGTPEYMAPEQIECEGIDGRTDLYAVGVLAFELIAGRRPFDGPSDFEIMRAHVEEPVPDLRALRPDVPLEVANVIASALAKDPSHRFQSARAMAVALHHASRALPDDAWGPLTDGGPPRPRAALVLPRDSTTEEAPRPGDTFQTGGDRIAAEVPSTVVTRASRPSARSRPSAPVPVDAKVPSTPLAPPPRRRRSRVLAQLIAGGALTASVALLVASKSCGGAPPATGQPSALPLADAGTSDARLVLVSPPIDAASDAATAPHDAPVDATRQRTERLARAVDAGSAPVPIRDAAVVASRIDVDAGVAPADAATPRIERTFHGLDAVGGISEITDLAREIVPDAELTAVHFWGVRVDAGTVGAEYRFRSARKRDASPCAVIVRLSPRWEERNDPNGLQTAHARVDDPGYGADPCLAPTIRRPTCAAQRIMDVAAAVPGHDDVMQQLTWTGTQWTFRAHYLAKGWETRPLPDQCR